MLLVYDPLYMVEEISLILGELHHDLMANSFLLMCFKESISLLYDYETITPHPREYGFNEALGH